MPKVLKPNIFWPILSYNVKTCLLLYSKSLDNGRTPEAGKQDQCPFHSHWSFYKQIRAFFVFLVPVFEGPLLSKVALLIFVFGHMWWKLLTFTRGSHTFTLTRGEISSECVTKGVIGRTSAEYGEESEISIKWIWNSWSSRLCSLRYSVFSFIFPCIHRQFGLECSAKKICVWFRSGPLLMRGMEGLVGPWRLQICHIRKSPQLAPASGPPPSPHPSTLYYMSATK